MATKKSTSDAFQRLAAAENAFLKREFLAPVLRGGGVQVRIAGVRCQLSVDPPDFEGWGVFQPASHTLAKLVRTASMLDRRRYLDLLPKVSLILAYREGLQWLATPGSAGDRRFEIEGLVPVRLPDEADLFDTIIARFDGGQFWFDELDPRADPAAASHLRQSLLAGATPDMIDRPGLAREQRDAFAANRGRRNQIEAARRMRELELARATDEGRLREALAHAGAELQDFTRRADAYRVTYLVDGARHISVVSQRDLTVQTAGICLSGEDRKFDLESLVGVLREGAAQE